MQWRCYVPPGPDVRRLLRKRIDYEGLRQYMDELLPTENIFHAVKDHGHLLECVLEDVKIEIDHTAALKLVLPGEGAFWEADLEKERPGELERVEN